jgi:hypothetical protein
MIDVSQDDVVMMRWGDVVTCVLSFEYEPDDSRLLGQSFQLRFQLRFGMRPYLDLVVVRDGAMQHAGKKH